MKAIKSALGWMYDALVAYSEMRAQSTLQRYGYLRNWD